MSGTRLHVFYVTPCSSIDLYHRLEEIWFIHLLTSRKSKRTLSTNLCIYLQTYTSSRSIKHLYDGLYL